MRTYIGRFCLDCLETFRSIDHNQCIKHLLFENVLSVERIK